MESLAADLFRTIKNAKDGFEDGQCLRHQKKAYTLTLHVSGVEATRLQE